MRDPMQDDGRCAHGTCSLLWAGVCSGGGGFEVERQTAVHAVVRHQTTNSA